VPEDRSLGEQNFLKSPHLDEKRVAAKTPPTPTPTGIPTIQELEAPIFRRVFAIRKPQKVWEWIEENVRIPKESGSRLCGPVDTSINAYFRFLYDAYGDPKTRFITLVKSAQIGATLFLKNLICYDVEHSGVAQLYITSTGDQAG
jgi:Phage terminase large subunit (GpA)